MMISPFRVSDRPFINNLFNLVLSDTKRFSSKTAKQQISEKLSENKQNTQSQQSAISISIKVLYFQFCRKCRQNVYKYRTL